MSLFSPAQPRRLLRQPALSLPKTASSPRDAPLPRSVLPQFRPSTDESRASENNPQGRASTVMIAGRLSAPATLSGPAMSITVSANCNDFGSDTSEVTNSGSPDGSESASMTRNLSDIALSTAVNDPRPSASYSARKNPQCIPANALPVFPGLRPHIWTHLVRLVTNDNIGQAPCARNRHPGHCSGGRRAQLGTIPIILTLRS